MATATGRKGYTGYLNNGSYAQNGAVVSSPTAGTSSSGASASIGSVAQGVNSYTNNLASSIAGFAGTDASSYGDMIREALEVSANNTAASQAMAREQMDYQTKSNETAMAWSAQEAQKNRDWQTEMSNTAHQREVNDLIAAGLNPILSANNGAYTGSGATGQGFSSSGAQGSVDTSANSVLGQLMSTAMNTASQAYIAGLYNDTSKYGYDLAYQEALLNADTQILTNSRTTEASKYNAAVNASALMSSAATTASATRYASDNNLAASKYSSDNSLSGTKYSSDNSLTGTKYNADQNLEGAHVSNYRTATGAAYEAARTVVNAATTATENLAKKSKADTLQEYYDNYNR